MRTTARETVRKLAPAVTALLMSILLFWTAQIDRAAEQARSVAESADAKGEQGKAVAATTAAVAATTTQQAQAGYDATKTKVDATGDVLAELAAEVRALREELERMKAARAGHRPRRRAAVKVPAVVTQPLPATPAAAAKEQAAIPETEQP